MIKLSFKKWLEVMSQGGIVEPATSSGTQKATQLNLSITHSGPGSKELPPNSKEQYHMKAGQKKSDSNGKKEKKKKNNRSKK